MPGNNTPEGSKGPSPTGGPSATFSPQFGAALEPSLKQACGNCLGDIHWFRTDWQRGGALTAYAKWQQEDGRSVDVVIKLPVPPQELRWLKRLQPEMHEYDHIVPFLYASGLQVGGYDLAWVVMERLPFGPLDKSWQGQEWNLLIDVLGRFYAASESEPVDSPARTEDWHGIIKRARHNLRDLDLPEPQRWNHTLKPLSKKLKKLLAEWDERDIRHWCHGDVHLANAMSRTAPPDGPAIMFDFAEVHAGHWVEDAVYLEHIFWGHEQRLNGHNLVKQIATKRKELHIKLEPKWPRLADIRRVLLAASAPAYPRTAGDAIHMHAALIVLETATQRLHLL